MIYVRSEDKYMERKELIEELSKYRDYNIVDNYESLEYLEGLLMKLYCDAYIDENLWGYSLY